MGCNSHTYIEYRRKEHKDANWMSFLPYEVDRRHYPLYAEMAGIRNYGDQITPIAPPRGLPEDVGHDAKRGYYRRIDDKLASDGWPGYVSSDNAARWISKGISIFCPDDVDYISDPDVHSASWLTSAEFASAVREVASDDVYWMAILAMVESVANTDGFECRVVFWFDN